jgi:hypothetical protein
MHERRLRWKPVPRCVECGRVLTALSDEGVAACERCLTIRGEIVPDTPAKVAAAFQAAVVDADRLVLQTRAVASIWDVRLGPGPVNARIVSGSARGSRGWSVLRLTPSFGADVEVFALATSAIGEAVRVVLAGVAPNVRVTDVRSGRTLVVTAA